MTVAELNALPPSAAVEAFLQCCKSSLWAEVMEALRPFRSRAQILTEARKAWGMLSDEDWREALNSQPSTPVDLLVAAEAQAQATQVRLEQLVEADA